ncbi:unnamed protein product [Brassicogethes aeneus]|uniref:RNA-binding region-containing protein 3 n=1 Tax=Brassicogethes aeneus TaxID=1431903 RepID=A0A9P0FCI6_BRAAE|nr:unnamed protein product [Brassicogethes aeneus]
MVCKDTLRIKNLPKELSDAQKEDFARHFGASKIKVITSRAQGRSIVYAKFESNEIARSVLFRLHQITVLKNVLCVEYAEKDILQGRLPVKKIDEPVENQNKFFKAFVNKIHAFNDSVGFHQPPPPHLKYEYPKANRATVSNIAHALATIPKFYVQVLHLMNKMNLPPPFVLQSNQPLSVAQKVPQQPPERPQSSSESELESDEENSKIVDVIPQKRSLPHKKVVKRPKFIKPQVAQPSSATKVSEKAENVFDKNDIVERKIELKVSQDSLENKQDTEAAKTGSFGIMLPLVKPVIEEQEEESRTETPKKVITEEELLGNQIPPKDLGVLPVFKNYHPGAPTCRLYIKNIAKTVTTEDLEHIFNLYQLEEVEGQPSQFDIRLMQEGRMKGQAFVTLENVEVAQKALKQTNGYILKNKPMVVVFAKSAAPKAK